MTIRIGTHPDQARLARVLRKLDPGPGGPRVIGMEREAFGLDTVAGTDGRPTVIIKDYTGRGSPEAPVVPASYH